MYAKHILILAGTTQWVLVAGHRTRRPTVTYAEAIAKTGCDLTLSQEE